MTARMFAFTVAVVCALSVGCSDRSDSTATSPQNASKPAAGRSAETPGTPKSDADRIADVHAIAGLVEDVKQKTGHYPYEEAFLNPEPGFEAVPALVIISRQPLPEQYRNPPPGVSASVYSYDEFLAYLKETLGHDVILPCDSEPAPRFYQYQFDGHNYYVSAVLIAATSDTRQLAPKWHKYQVSSASAPEKKILRFVDIK